MDVSHLPRVDQYQVVQDPNDLRLPSIPSDVKTVTYFVQTPGTGTGSVADPLVGTGRDAAAMSGGLVRREVDRSVMQFALEAGAVDALVQTGDLVAPEVTAIQFQYFDGYEWLPQWDCEQMQGLPVAIEVAIVVQRRTTSRATSVNTWMEGGEEAGIYRLLVHLPLGEPAALESAETQEGLENVGL
jgi:hypothetical protein